MITGLSFGHIPKCDKKSLQIRDTYFKGENKVRNDELEKVFLSLGDEKKRNKNKKNKKIKKEFEDEEVIKLALLYFFRARFIWERRKKFNRYGMGCFG